MAQMNLSTEQKQSHRHREQTCSHQGGGVGRDELEVWSQYMQTITYRMDKQQVLLYNTESCIQYPGIKHHGKEYKKEYMCVCVCVSLEEEMVAHSSILA